MLDFVADALAVYRLTHLVISDSIADAPRARVMESAHAAGWDKLNEGLRCYYCVSAYSGAFIVLARRLAPRTWDPIAKALAFSAVTGLLSTLG